MIHLILNEFFNCVSDLSEVLFFDASTLKMVVDNSSTVLYVSAKLHDITAMKTSSLMYEYESHCCECSVALFRDKRDIAMKHGENKGNAVCGRKEGE
jgi:hypothetical protein